MTVLYASNPELKPSITTNYELDYDRQLPQLDSTRLEQVTCCNVTRGVEPRAIRQLAVQRLLHGGTLFRRGGTRIIAQHRQAQRGMAHQRDHIQGDALFVQRIAIGGETVEHLVRTDLAQLLWEPATHGNPPEMGSPRSFGANLGQGWVQLARPMGQDTPVPPRPQ